MNETNDFALVRNKAGAVEKTAPGAKQIVSGMVADTLALAKKPKGETLQEHTARMLRWRAQDQAALKAGKLRSSGSLPAIRNVE